MQEVQAGVLGIGVAPTNYSGLCNSTQFVAAYNTCLTDNCVSFFFFGIGLMRVGADEIVE